MTNATRWCAVTVLAAMAVAIEAPTVCGQLDPGLGGGWHRKEEPSPHPTQDSDTTDDWDKDSDWPEAPTSDDAGKNSWDATAGRTVTNEQAVRAAIGRAVEYLRGAQHGDGGFDDVWGMQFPNGETALALLALRYAGVPFDDPAVQKAFKRLAEGQPARIYVESLIAQCLATIPPARRTTAVRAWMKRTGSFLVKSQLDDGTWSYMPQSMARERRGDAWAAASLGPTGDNSSTQFAVLGLWKLAEAGVELDPRALRLCEKHFLDTQLGIGAWGYLRPGEHPDPLWTGPRPSMTATGLATLHIFLDTLHLHDEGLYANGRAGGCGKASAIQQHIDRASGVAGGDLARFLRSDTPFRLEPNILVPDAGVAATDRVLTDGDLYYLFSVERVGAATGRKSLGSIDWHRSIARLVLSQQRKDGSWGIANSVWAETPVGTLGGQKSRPGHVVGTAFGIICLAKAAEPIFINKLAYDGDWNNDLRDAAHLAAFAAENLEQPFSWQIVDVRSPVDDWFDAPLLYMSGHNAPRFSDEQRKKLKDYVDRGGFIFAEACCSQSAFAEGIRKVAAEIWPDLQWQKLPADHALLTAKSHVALKQRLPLEGLTDATGFTFLVLSPRDVSCIWNQNLTTNHQDEFLLGINLYRYAKRGRPVRSMVGM